MTAWSADERYEALVREHGDALLRLAVLITGNAHDGEDAVQDALIQVAAKWRETAEQSQLAYLKRAVANRAIDVTRRRRDILTDAVPESAVEPDFLAFDEDRAFFRMLQHLPQRQRAVLVLRFYANLDDRAIGRALGCTASTVRSQAHHAMRRLRADAALTQGRA